MNYEKEVIDLEERRENSKRICRSVTPEVWLVSDEYKFNLKTLDHAKELKNRIIKKMRGINYIINGHPLVDRLNAVLNKDVQEKKK